MREWMKVVLGEVERKKLDEEEAKAECQRRIAETRSERDPAEGGDEPGKNRD